MKTRLRIGQRISKVHGGLVHPGEDDDAYATTIRSCDEQPRKWLNIKSKQPPKKAKKSKEDYFLFEWQRTFCAVRDTSLDTGLPPTTRLVLLTLACFMDPDGTNAYPGQERIAKDAGLSLRTTKLHLLLAEEKGWIRRKRNHKSKHGRGYSYTATLPQDGDSRKPGIAASRIRHDKKGDT